jgi:hypothetical protein
MRQKVRRSRDFKGLGQSGQKAKGDRRAIQPGNAVKSKPIDLAPSFARRKSTKAEKLHWPLKQPNQLFNRAIALCRNAG